jgi:hypothetical protein
MKERTLPEIIKYAALTGFTVATLNHPLDVVRRRLQSSGIEGIDPLVKLENVKEPGKDGKMLNARQVIRKIYSESGIRGFYKCWYGSHLRMVPHNVIQFTSLELIMSGFFKCGCFE